MARLQDETITTIFYLPLRLLERIDEATATEATIFARFGEAEETLPELEQLQNVRERATSSYSRLYTLLLRIAEAQPTPTSATLKLLAQSIEQAQANDAAIDASVEDIKRNWNLL